MSSEYFLTLRDQGARLWVEIETHRLSQASLLKSKAKHEKRLRIAAGVGGAIAGIGASPPAMGLGSVVGWGILCIGLVPGLCALLSPSEEITKTTERAEQLAALRVEIYDHVERMRVAPTVSIADIQFIDRKRQDFVASLIADTTDVQAFKALAEAELNKMNFHRLDYIGAGEAGSAEAEQAASDDITAFTVGG